MVAVAMEVVGVTAMGCGTRRMGVYHGIELDGRSGWVVVVVDRSTTVGGVLRHAGVRTDSVRAGGAVRAGMRVRCVCACVVGRREDGGGRGECGGSGCCDQAFEGGLCRWCSVSVIGLRSYARKPPHNAIWPSHCAMADRAEAVAPAQRAAEKAARPGKKIKATLEKRKHEGPSEDISK